MAPTPVMADSDAMALLTSHLARATTQEPRIAPTTAGLAAGIHDSVLSCVGATPLVRMDRLAGLHGLRCNLLAKLEYFNAGGSVKDRIALRMVTEAEKDGRLVPGKSVVIEPTSGNTGIGLALACAVKGYKCIITLPEKMSREKVNTLKALGAQIVRTPTEAAHDSPESNISVARRLEKAIPGGVILDQYNNPDNPNAHYDGTGAEIVSAIEASVSQRVTPEMGPLTPPDHPSTGVVDLLVAGAGTGGTITGISRRLKDHWGADRVTTLGVDPFGSVLARPGALNDPSQSVAYAVEGIGYDFIPSVLDHQVVDIWMKGSDAEAFAMTRSMIRHEGVLCGGSSGQAMAGAINYLKSEEGWRRFGGVEGKNVVVVAPDGLRNYITKSWLSEEDGSGEVTETELLVAAQESAMVK